MSVDPSSRLAQAEASIAALWARMNTITNAGGQVTIIGSGGGAVASIGAKASGSAVLASGVTQFDFRSGLSAVLDGTSEIDVALGNLTANWTQSGAFDIYTVGGVGIGSVTTPLDIVLSGTTQTSIFGLRRDGTGFPMIFSQHSSTGPTTFGSFIVMAKSRGSYGSPSIVSQGDLLGGLRFYGYDGTDYEQAGSILCFVDATPGSNDMPGRIIFSVTADGGTSPSEVFRISNDKSARFSGAIFVGGTSAPAASAQTEWSSTTQGLKGPNMTVAQRDAISSPATGLRVYTTDANNNDFYDGTAWRQVDSSDGNQYATVATTDATVTTLATITCAASTTTQIEARVSARRTGGSSGTAEDGAAYVIRAAIKNVGGTATIIGAVNADFTAEDQAGWDATIDVTGATARVRVTGAANNNINWKAQVRTLTVT